ncbi:MAG TPA: hypothetical protein VGB58_00235 [Blastococcus sp.]|jgi:hypothetical protein
MITTASRLRPIATRGDVEVLTALSVLRDLTRRVSVPEAEAAEHEQAIRTIVAPGGRTCRSSPALGQSSPPQS